MPWSERDDNLSVSKMGLSEDIVSRLTKEGITGWGQLTILTLKEVADLGFNPQEVSLIFNSVGKYTLHG